MLKCAYFGATSNNNRVVRQYYMGKSRTMPSADSGFIGVKLVSDTLPGHVMDANSYGGLYPDELKRLQKDYADLWGPLSDLLAQLSAIVTM